MRLACIISRHHNVRIYFHNYFTSLRLSEYLARESIVSLDTVSRNSIPDFKPSSDKRFPRRIRHRRQQNQSLMILMKANKIVHLASFWPGKKPEFDEHRVSEHKPMWLENTIAIWVVSIFLVASWTSTRYVCGANDGICAWIIRVSKYKNLPELRILNQQIFVPRLPRIST